MRPIKTIEIESKPATALFDTGAFHSYVIKNLISEKNLSIPVEPFKVALGGRIIEVKEICLFRGKIEGLGFHTEAIPVDDLGSVDGKKLDAIIGALTMEGWEIKIDLKTGELDLTGLKRREFTEY